MSTPYTIATPDRVYTVVDDCVTTYAAAITGAITDEIMGAFDSPGFKVNTVRKDLQTKSTANGLYAITAYPASAFSKLSTQSYTIDYTLSAPGFRDIPMSMIIPAGSTLPVPAPGAAMRRLPVRLQGRVVRDATGLPAAGMNILGVDNPNPPSPLPPPPLPHTLLLRSPLYSDHPVTSSVQQATLTVTGTAQLQLIAAARSTSIQLNTLAGLSGSAFVQLASTDFTRIEYAMVTGTGPTPGLVTLSKPLNRTFLAKTATNVQFVTATLAGTLAHLLLDANAGDGILVADQLLQVSTVAVDSGSAVEYHELGSLTDANGYYAADGIGRVQQLFLRPNPGTPGLPVISWAIEYDHAINVVNFRI